MSGKDGKIVPFKLPSKEVGATSREEALADKLKERFVELRSTGSPSKEAFLTALMELRVELEDANSGDV